MQAMAFLVELHEYHLVVAFQSDFTADGISLIECRENAAELSGSLDRCLHHIFTLFVG